MHMPASSLNIVRRLGSALILLLIELAALTPLIEFRQAPLAILASGNVCLALFAAGITYLLLLLRLDRDDQNGIVEPRKIGEIALWAIVHVCSFVAFFGYSVMLQKGVVAPNPQSAAVWSFVAISTFASGLLTFLSPESMRRIASQTWPQLLAAILTAVTTVALIPVSRRLWTIVHPATMAIVDRLLAWHTGQTSVHYLLNGLPVIGTQRVQLLVTSGCSEMDSLLVFWLVWLVVIGGNGARVRKFRAILALGLGSMIILLLNAIRLFGLVLLGEWRGAEWAVHVAHSRIGAFGFLAVTTAVCWWASRPRQPPQPIAKPE
jgi:exosortase/archaeosortase family protein